VIWNLHAWGYVAFPLGLGDVCGLGVEHADLFFFFFFFFLRKTWPGPNELALLLIDILSGGDDDSI
jgi:hypothetical protein